MVRSTRIRAASMTASAFVAVCALVLMVGCASGRGMAKGCEPCGDPCEPCGTACDPCAGAPPGELPPGANPGEAWCRVWVPPEYCTQIETYCCEPAKQRNVMIPPKYGTRPKLVCVSEPELKERVVPAVWGVKKIEREVCPPRECWQQIQCPPSNLGPCEVQCECWTKREIPGVYCDEPCPVCLSPERRCVKYTPARYEMQEERYLEVPARCETVCEPAKFAQRTKEVCVKPGHWEWRRNETCEVPACPPAPCAPPPCAPPPCAPPPCAPPTPEPLPALQVEMVDNAESGAAAGQFSVGDVVRYDLMIVSDEGAQALDGLRVLFSLPPELEFVSGEGAGLAVSGGGQTAETTAFDLRVGQTMKVQLLARVLSAPPTNLVRLTASVVDADGQELATETESTTLKP